MRQKESQKHRFLEGTANSSWVASRACSHGPRGLARRSPAPSPAKPTSPSSRSAARFVRCSSASAPRAFPTLEQVEGATILIGEIDAVGSRRRPGGGRRARTDPAGSPWRWTASVERAYLLRHNRPDVLDPALLRPRRFDRRIVRQPSGRERREALFARTKKIPLPRRHIWPRRAGTSGFSGADLANWEQRRSTPRYNERSSHGGLRTTPGQVAGNAPSMIINDEKKVTAVHEAGHALLFRPTPTRSQGHDHPAAWRRRDDAAAVEASTTTRALPTD